MRNTALLSAALASVLATSAFAQDATPNTTPPAATAPAVTPPSTAFIDRQATDQKLASDVIGMKVHGPNDESLGEVNDLVLDANGAVVATVIGVGGFLGMGEKEVAVPYQSLRMVRNADGERLVLAHTKDELKSAPQFEAITPEPTTTGSINTKPAAPAPAR